MKVAIIKYNAGNIFSVLYALKRIGVEAEVTDDFDTIRNADKVIFPGVGEASTAMAYLKEKGLDSLIKSLKQPVLGICIGLQLMCQSSEEGNAECMGIFDVKVQKFDNSSCPEFKIPHMGWNTLDTRDCPLFDAGSGICVYFVHSYCMADVSDEWTAATCTYGQTFTAAICKGNVMATQFHPEKSGEAGLRMLKRFAEWKGAATC